MPPTPPSVILRKYKGSNPRPIPGADQGRQHPRHSRGGPERERLTSSPGETLAPFHSWMGPVSAGPAGGFFMPLDLFDDLFERDGNRRERRRSGLGGLIDRVLGGDRDERYREDDRRRHDERARA